MEFKGEYAFLSNGYRCDIILTKKELLKYSDDNLHNYIKKYLPNGFCFKSAGHAFYSLKAKDIMDFIMMLNCKSGYEAYELSKTIKGRNKWAVYKDGIIELVTVNKFKQNKDLQDKIIKIDEPIHFDTNYPNYEYGRTINDNYKGQDKLGKILTNIKKEIIKEKTPKIEEDLSLKKSLNGSFSLKNEYASTVDDFIDDIEDNVFFVVDSETSGLDPKHWDIIELSAIKVDGNTFEIIDEFDEYINPGYKLPPNIVEFNKKNGTGICDKLLQQEGLNPKEAAIKFNKFVGDNPCIMGQNVSFDIKFIQKLYHKNLKKDFEYLNVVDTLKMAKEKIPGKRNLDILYGMIPESFNVPELSFHKSIDDVKATLEVFKWISQSEYHIPIMNKDLDISTVDYNLD